MRDECAGEFHYALVQGQILEKMLSPQERESLLDFFRDGFLDRIEKESDFGRDRGRKANAWIFRFNDLGSAARGPKTTDPVAPIWTSHITEAGSVGQLDKLRPIVNRPTAHASTTLRR
jgi:hypothetical protein